MVECVILVHGGAWAIPDDMKGIFVLLAQDSSAGARGRTVARQFVLSRSAASASPHDSQIIPLGRLQVFLITYFIVTRNPWRNPVSTEKKSDYLFPGIFHIALLLRKSKAFLKSTKFKLSWSFYYKLCSIVFLSARLWSMHPQFRLNPAYCQFRPQLFLILFGRMVC